MATKRPNWAAIKKRYLQGEKPKDIAKDYGLTAKQISNRAHDDGWTSKKQKISEKIELQVESEIEQLKRQVIEEYKRLAFSNMQSFAEWGTGGVRLVDSVSLDDDAASCVAEVSQTITKDGGSIRFKLHDKKGALDSLAKYLKLFDESKGEEEQTNPFIGMPGVANEGI